MSKSRLVWAAFILLASVQLSSKSDDSPHLYFASEPSLSPDGKTIVFAYDNDLWTVPSEGGSASRITAMAGRESNPRYSPDGKWIAFTARQDGNANIYMMPTDGGDIKQLTWHEGSSSVESWSWDSKYIYFTSDAYNGMSSYKIPVSGGTPQRLFQHYFNWPHNLVENPKTGEWYFTDSWESSRFANRKHYKGEFNPDIKSWDPKTGDYKVHTTYNGKDMWPTIDQSGNIYYVSDQENDEYNLYKLTDDKPKALTHFKTSIKQPQVDAAGDKVVFEKDYQVYLYDVASGKSELVPIQLSSNNTLELSEGYTVKGNITAFDLSPDEKKLAFISRGELFVGDAEGKFVRQLNMDGNGRAIEVKWLADSKSLIYSKTVNGWANWFRISADGNGKEEQLTNEIRSNRALSLNKKRTFGVYLSGSDQLRKIDLGTGKSETIVKDEFWAIENTTPAISPDDQYVAYTAKRNFEDDIFLFHFSDNNIIDLTNTGVTETNPVWSPDGKYIYFNTDRTHPAYPYGLNNSKVYRIALDQYDKDFKADKFNKLFTKEDKADSANATPYPLNVNDITERWEEITPGDGLHEIQSVTIKKDETRVYFSSKTDGKTNPLSYWASKPFASPEIKKIEGVNASESQMVQGKTKLLILNSGNIYDIDADGAKAKEIDISFQFSRNLEKEFNEMFYETWANLDENYYDPEFHGVDWDKMRSRYEAFLPYVKTRTNLRVLINDMLGELNSSHQGFYSNGLEEKTYYSSRTFETGVVFDENEPYKVASIVANSPADKKDKDIKQGDILYAVDDHVVDVNKDRDFYFSRPDVPDEAELSFKRGVDIIKVKIHPETPTQFKGQLFDQWIAGNQKEVDDKTGKKVAYIMMKDMGDESLKKFQTEIANEGYNRDGLIVDLRYNTGGNVHDEVLDMLSRRPYLQWKYRDGKITTQPNFFPNGKPIILLVNEQTLSDGEMTATGFQALKLGKIIGAPTYHWIIFTSAKTMVDGSVCRLPSWGCYKLNGDDIEKTGVIPDIIVRNNIKDRSEGKDPQLDKAIEEIMGEMK